MPYRSQLQSLLALLTEPGLLRSLSDEKHVPPDEVLLLLIELGLVA